MDQREKKIRQRIKNDLIAYCKVCLKIKGKSGSVFSFTTNRAQIYIHRKLEEQRAATGKVRAVILKGRQQGCSTYIGGRFYHQTTHRKGCFTYILTHEMEATQTLFGMVERFHNNNKSRFKPSTSRTNRKELKFDRLDSGYGVGTAGSKETGRSSNIQLFHGSEVAFWPNADTHVNGVMNAIGDLPGTEIILESTSAGPSGLFYDYCMKAHKKVKGFDYQLIFVPWYWQEEYRKPIEPGFTPTEEEMEYKEAYGLNLEQVNWRRSKIVEAMHGIDDFRREYPATIEEAFMDSIQGALWSREVIKNTRVDVSPEFKKVVIAIDPAGGTKMASDETGLVACGLGVDGHGYLISDQSGRYHPSEWGKKAVEMYYRWQANEIIAESNYGGEMVKDTIKNIDDSVPVHLVNASRGKHVRAEPIAALHHEGKVHMVGYYPVIEDQLVLFTHDGWQGKKSPDRADAFVWGMTRLLVRQLKRPSYGVITT